MLQRQGNKEQYFEMACVALLLANMLPACWNKSNVELKLNLNSEIVHN